MFSCKECQHVESSEDMLKVHYDAVHIRKESNRGQRFSKTSESGIKHPCRQCAHQFSSKGHLAEHRKAVHEGVKHPC